MILQPDFQNLYTGEQGVVFSWSYTGDPDGCKVQSNDWEWIMKCHRDWRLLARTQHCNNSESYASQITNQAREVHGPQDIQQPVHPSCLFEPLIGFNVRAGKPIAASLAMQLDVNSSFQWKEMDLVHRGQIKTYTR